MELLGDGYVSVTDTTNQIVTILRDCRHVNVVEFDTLYPIDVKFLGHHCYPYVLLRQDGMMDHSEFTPYFVRTIEKRDAILQWLNRI